MSKKVNTTAPKASEASKAPAEGTGTQTPATPVPATVTPITAASKATEGTAVPDTVQTVATTETEQAFADYVAPEGVRELQRKLGERLEGMGARVLRIAQASVRAAIDRHMDTPERTHKLALQLFRASMERASGILLESIPKGDAERHDAVTEFLDPSGTWFSYASTLRGAIQDGIDLLPFKSETAVRAARKKLKEAQDNAGGTDTPEQSARKEASTTSGAAAIVSKSSDKVREAVNAFLNLIKNSDLPDYEDEVTAIVIRANKALLEYQRDDADEGDRTGTEG